MPNRYIISNWFTWTISIESRSQSCQCKINLNTVLAVEGWNSYFAKYDVDPVHSFELFSIFFLFHSNRIYELIHWIVYIIKLISKSRHRLFLHIPRVSKCIMERNVDSSQHVYTYARRHVVIFAIVFFQIVRRNSRIWLSVCVYVSLAFYATFTWRALCMYVCARMLHECTKYMFTCIYIICICRVDAQCTDCTSAGAVDNPMGWSANPWKANRTNGDCMRVVPLN